MTMVKIAERKISRNGLRGLIISLPAVWVQDMNLKNGDSVTIFRDQDDNLVITKGVAHERDN